MSWKEYELIEDKLADWLPWGGLTHPAVMQCKDDSFFGVIAYTPYEKEKIRAVNLPNFKNGWNLWIEHQHMPGFDRDFIVVSWNPFFNRRGNIINGTGNRTIPWNAARNAFYKVLQVLAENLSVLTDCQILEYQEIVDFLEFTLAMDARKVEMPDVPLYLDALLSQDINLDFSRNHLRIDDKKLCIVSLPAMAEHSDRKKIAKYLQGEFYRHVQRLLLLGEKRSRKECEWYMNSWCPGRKSLKNFIREGLLGKLNGYHMEAFLIAFREDEHRHKTDGLKALLNQLQLPYIVENYNHKQVWWGSIPGMFRSNIVPPITGFDGLENLLYKTDIHHGHREGEENVSYELV